MSVLDDILAGVRSDLERRQALVTLDALKERAAHRPAGRNGFSALRRDDGVTVIAEVKRSAENPSRPAGRCAARSLRASRVTSA